MYLVRLVHSVCPEKILSERKCKECVEPTDPFDQLVQTATVGLVFQRKMWGLSKQRN